MFCFISFYGTKIAALGHITKEDDKHRESATRLMTSMINIKAIIAHFNAKIDEYSSQNQIVSLSEEQVLEVVKQNFDSLTLRLQDQLDTFESYDPTKPEEYVFLMKLLADIIQDYAHENPIAVSADEQCRLLQLIQQLSLLNNSSISTLDNNGVACSGDDDAGTSTDSSV